MRILAIDPSIVSLGWAVIDGGEYVASGSRRSRRKGDPDRVHEMASFCAALIEEHRPEVVGIERPRFFRRAYRGKLVGRMNWESIQKLNWVVGAILDRAMASPVGKIILVRIDQWNPKHSKEATANKVWYVTGKKLKAGDVADAVAIGLWIDSMIRLGEVA